MPFRAREHAGRRCAEVRPHIPFQVCWMEEREYAKSGNGDILSLTVVHNEPLPCARHTDCGDYSAIVDSLSVLGTVHDAALRPDMCPRSNVKQHSGSLSARNPWLQEVTKT